MREFREPDDGGTEPLSRWREAVEALIEEAKDYARRKPMEGLLIAFAAGFLLSTLGRRER